MVFVPGDLEKSWVSEHVGAICLAQTQETFGGFGIIMYHTVSYEFIIYIYIELYDDSVWIEGFKRHTDTLKSRLAFWNLDCLRQRHAEIVWGKREPSDDILKRLK
jgi:hypothetical protein